MIKREMYFVFKNGEFPIDNIGIGTEQEPSPVRFVGGSPIVLTKYGVSGSLDELSYSGIAMHAYNVFADRGVATYITAPAIVTLFKGTDEDLYLRDENSTYEAKTDPTAPWDESVTLAEGDLLRPKVVTIDDVDYAVWTNEEYSAGASGDVLYYPARVISVGGRGYDTVSKIIPENFDFITIELGWFPKVKS